MEKFIKFITNEKFYLPIVYIVVGLILYLVIEKVINRISKGHIGNSGKDKRKDTIINLGRSIFKYLILIFIVLGILKIYGIDTTSIIASLGVFAAVIGLAFQDIIKDFLAGIFIIFDNAYAVGDWIKIDNFKGEVISMGLKTTKLRAYTGEIMILSNSSFNKVINYNLNTQKIYLEIPFSYDEKIEKIESILSDVLVEIKKEKEVKKTELLGVNEFKDSFIVYALDVDCSVGNQFKIKRLLLKKIKTRFDSEGVVIPYNQLDVHIEK